MFTKIREIEIWGLGDEKTLSDQEEFRQADQFTNKNENLDNLVQQKIITPKVTILSTSIDTTNVSYQTTTGQFKKESVKSSRIQARNFQLSKSTTITSTPAPFSQNYSIPDSYIPDYKNAPITNTPAPLSQNYSIPDPYIPDYPLIKANSSYTSQKYTSPFASEYLKPFQPELSQESSSSAQFQ